MNDQDLIYVNKEFQNVITIDQAWHYTIIPKSYIDDEIEFYVDQAKATKAFKEELEILFGKKIILEGINSDIIYKSLSKYYRRQTNYPNESRKVSTIKSEDFLQNLILEAKSLGSSDIHVEVYEEKCRIRIRIDGLLIERYTLNKIDYPALINKIKIKSNLDIAEKRLPQDGRIFFSASDEKFDIRVSVIPTLHGEKVVLRLLSNDATNVNIEELGFSHKELSDFLEGVKRPHGILLISGPTGSGKTTTLYATLKLLNKEKTNILTVEDPIEYTLEGINQVQLKENIGLTFASALRTFLRQDPDIIMLGEIRDSETAQMAIRAALTGHLVLSTIHTNSAIGTITRLIDMGIPSYLIASILNTTVAQRLIRLLCPNCKEEKVFDSKNYPSNYKAPEVVVNSFTAKGCERCYFTGYKGRKALYEVVPIDYNLSEVIRTNNPITMEMLKERQISTLGENAFAMFKSGVTSLDEVYSILSNNI